MLMRWLIIGFLGVAFPSSLAARGIEKPLKERIAEIAREHEAREKEFHEELKIAGRDMDKVNKANTNFNKGWHERIDAVKGLVHEHGEDPAAFDGILVIVGPMRSFLDEDLTAIASKHLADPRAGELCFALRYRSGESWAEGLLKQAAKTHPSREVRGQATFALGDFYRNSAFPWGRSLPESEVAALLDRASAFYSEASKDYPSASTPDGKSRIGEKADLELTRLRNLPDLKAGRPAPEIVGEGIDGKPFKLSDYKGKVVVVVFWGSWCGPCMAMVPHERELRERLKDKPFALLGVNCGDKRETAKETQARRQMEWPSWWDGEDIRGPIETVYNIQQWPTVYVIDPKGVIRNVDIRGKELDQAVDKLLTDSVPSGD